MLYAPFAYRYRKLDSSLEWVIGDTPSSARQRRRSNQGMINQMWSVPAVRSVLCGPGTALTEILKRGSFLFWAFGQVNENGTITRAAKPPAWADILVENLQRPTETPEPNEQTWELGTYGLDHLIVTAPQPIPECSDRTTAISTSWPVFSPMAPDRQSNFGAKHSTPPS